MREGEKMENWKNITSESDVLSIIKESYAKPQLIFKDSISCGISAYAKERLKTGNDLLTANAVFNYLDLLQYRSVSNFIANELNVRHQSPQIIVIKNGEVVYTSTHHAIDAQKIANILRAS